MLQIAWKLSEAAEALLRWKDSLQDDYSYLESWKQPPNAPNCTTSCEIRPCQWSGVVCDDFEY